MFYTIYTPSSLMTDTTRHSGLKLSTANSFGKWFFYLNLQQQFKKCCK